MVLLDHIVVTPLVIKSVIVLKLSRPLDLLRAKSQEVADLVVQYLTLLVFCEPWPFEEVLENFRTGQGQLKLLKLPVGNWHHRFRPLDDADLGIHQQVTT
jgi:hypothetical protein